jgi:hypothetical protein
VTELIEKLFRILCEIKDFNAGYDTETSIDGKMIIEYKGKRYAVLIEKMGECKEEDAFKSIKKLKYWF